MGRVIGLREFRRSISFIYDDVVNNFKEVIIGNIRKAKEDKVSMISTQVLDEILSVYEINPEYSYNDNVHEIMIDQIDIYGFGDTFEEAIEMVLDLVEDSVEEYFENIALYMRVPNSKAQYPYFLKISHSTSREDLKKKLNLDKIKEPQCQ